MNRGIITISESGSVSIQTAPIWMTMQEIADMLGVNQPQLICLWTKNPMA